MITFIRRVIAIFLLLIPGINVMTVERHDERYLIFNKKYHQHILSEHDVPHEGYKLVFGIGRFQVFEASLNPTGNLSAILIHANGEMEASRDLG